MALNIKNTSVEKLAAEVAEMTGETKTEANRRSLGDRQKDLIRTVRGLGYSQLEGAPSVGPLTLRVEVVQKVARGPLEQVDVCFRVQFFDRSRP